MSFDPLTDKIAITIPEFSVLKKMDGPFGKYLEPYIVSIAIDEHGTHDPKISFNVMPYPKVAVGGRVKMLGDGHLLYGPKNPGQFVALSVLIMESDSDLHSIGDTIETLISSKATELSIAAIVAANPGSSAILGILKELTQLIAGELKNNKDDEIFRTSGTFLRDHAVPYHINREYTDIGNDFINLSMKIIPLDAGNGQGSSVKELLL